MRRVGKDYHKYFEKRVNKMFFLKDQDGFNMSLINIKDNNYLFSIRYLGFYNIFKNNIDVVPGNYSNKKNIHKVLSEKIIKKINFGKNFFWQNWNLDLNDITILFIGKLDRRSLKIYPDKNFKPYIISNLRINNFKYKYSDIRLFKDNNNNIFCYDGYIKRISKISIDFEKFTIKLKKLNSINICQNLIKYDKNWSFFKQEKNFFIFLNWFENEKITLSYIPINNSNQCEKKELLTMKKDLIPGLGNDYLPMFSFGTPFIKIDEDNYISIGHTKLLTHKYYKNKNINNFKYNIRTLYKDNYIEHLSYFYCCYYIIINKKNSRYNFYFSDSILYIDTKEKYSFSINFPVGITQYNKYIYASLGVGDYYNYIIKEKIEDIKTLCKHNARNFDKETYNFIIKEF